jgi:hypothetical protein
MKASGLKPIATPPAQRLRQVQTTILPVVVFFGAVLLVAVLWREHVGATITMGRDTAKSNEVLQKRVAELTRLASEGEPSFSSLQLTNAANISRLSAGSARTVIINVRPGELVDISVQTAAD